jgi:hypothetical protein
MITVHNKLGLIKQPILFLLMATFFFTMFIHLIHHIVSIRVFQVSLYNGPILGVYPHGSVSLVHQLRGEGTMDLKDGALLSSSEENSFCGHSD